MGMGPGNSIKDAITAADTAATVLDDRLDLENAAVLRWLRAHTLGGPSNTGLVIGEDRAQLPKAWADRLMQVGSAKSARDLLMPYRTNKAAMRTLRSFAQRDQPGSPAFSDKEVLDRVANNLFAGTLWLMQVRPMPSRFVGKTSVSAFAPINPKFGTTIDFTFIAAAEGDQWLRGYVPIDKQGNVIGRSGMTVATGFDIGQWSEQQIRAFGFPAELTAKLLPFANHPFINVPVAGQKRIAMTRREVEAAVAKMGPVPELSKAEADLCDAQVFTAILGEAARSFNNNRAAGVAEFSKQPGGFQTVWLSRFYQEGGRTKVPAGKLFRTAALAGDFQKAIGHLRAYTEYKSRITAEADLMQRAFPAPKPAANPAPVLPAPVPAPAPAPTPAPARGQGPVVIKPAG